MSPYPHGVRSAIKALKSGDVGVLPTDTIYGIVGVALKKKTVERIYALRKRNPRKPMIVLIGEVRDVGKFGVALGATTKRFLKKVWPGKVSVILSISKKTAITKFTYLHRGTRSLAFRLPKPRWLRTLLRKTGPLVAPSANFEGKPAARTISAAKKYFGDHAAFYLNAGHLVSEPSTLVKVKNGKMVVLRKGAVKV
jgi:L-threonylcarbamoyladenylate synthase